MRSVSICSSAVPTIKSNEPDLSSIGTFILSGYRAQRKFSAPSSSGTQTHICPMKRAKNSQFRGSCVFSEKDNLFQNHLRYKHFSRIHPQDRCKVRHFRDSEKRLPCGIRTVALRRRSRKKFRSFQKKGANLPPCLAITPIEGRVSKIFFDQGWNISLFFAYVRDGREAGSKFFPQRSVFL